jgi:hypothetical protein
MTHTHTHTYIHTPHTHTYNRTHTHTHIHTYTKTYAHKDARMNARADMHAHVLTGVGIKKAINKKGKELMHS